MKGAKVPLDAMQLPVRAVQSAGALWLVVDANERSVSSLLTRTEAEAFVVWIGDTAAALAEKTVEIERLKGALEAARIDRLKSPSQICHEYHVQNCHFCDDFECRDNTTKAKARIAELQAALAAERERCRREEVEPLWKACGVVFEKAHSLSQIIDVPQHLKQAIDEVLITADGMIQTRAHVGRVQAGTPIAAVRKVQEGAP